MGTATKNSDKLKQHVSKRPVLLTIICFIALAVIWVVLTVIIPLVQGDGVGNYAGAKKEAAQAAIDATERLIDHKSRWAYSFHVDDIHPVTDSEKAQSCHKPEFITSDTNRANYYTVVVSEHQLMTLQSTTHTVIGCNSTYNL